MLQTSCFLRRFCVILVALVASPVVHADPDPLSVARGSMWYPRGLGTELMTSPDRAHPTTVLTMPHLAADTRRAILGAAVGGAVGDGAAGGALGLTVPTRRYVWTGALGILGDADGGVGRGVVSLARPLGSRLAMGAGLGLSAASGTGASTRLGAALDIGVRYRLGGIGDVSRVEAHAAMLGIGTSAARPGFDAVVAPFTPVAGVRARLVDAPAVEIDAAASVRVESFSRTWLAAGTRLRFPRGMELSLGADIPLAGGATYWPGVSLGIRVPTGEAEGTDAAVTARPGRQGQVLVAGDVSTTFPSSDPRPPVLDVTVRAPEDRASQRFGAADENGPPDLTPFAALEQVNLAPVGGRGQLVVDVTATDDRAIGAITAVLTAPGGETVRRWRFEPFGEPVIEGDLSQRMTSDLAQRAFGSSLVWDLSEADRDGRYRLEVSATDAAGNVTRSSELGVVVDRTPPDLTLALSLENVSEDGDNTEGSGADDGDGALDTDTTPVELSPDRPLVVTARYGDAEIVDIDVVDQAGRSVVRLDPVPELEGDRTVEARWTGQRADGEPVADGVYRIRAAAEDAGGNRRVVSSGPVLVRRARPLFRLAVDRTVVSPEAGTTVTVTPDLRPLPGLREWTIDLRRIDAAADPPPVKTWSGIDLPPARLVLGPDAFPEDGTYVVEGRSRYDGGATATDRTEEFLVDRVAPRLSIGLSDIVIGPADPRRLVVFVEGDGTAASGTLMLRRDTEPDAVAVADFSQLPDEIPWQLIGADGAFLEAGVYAIWVEARDRAGNRGVSEVRRFELVPRLSGAEIDARSAVFSPNGDGRDDEVVFALRTPEDVERGTFTIDFEHGSQVRRISGDLPAPSSVSWDGCDNQGVPFADGPVTAMLRVQVPDRGEVTAESSPVVVDTTPPVLVLERDGPAYVSPDGDGVQDTLVLRGRAAGATRVQLELLTASDGSVLRRIPIPAGDQGSSVDAGRVEVAPRAADGTVLPDGSYAVRAVASDAAGNSATSDPVGFTVDTRPVSGFLRVSGGAISPNGDGFADRVTVEPILSDTDGLSDWSLVIQSAEGGSPVLQRSGTGAQAPASLEWPPSSDEVPRDGAYVARLEARYRHGAVVRTESPRIVVDTTAPEVEVTARPQPFSPDGDGRADTVVFSVGVEDRSPVEYWLLEVFDRTGAFFYDAGGRGAVPRRIRWDGRARNGELVTSAESYPWRLEVADELGNIAVREGSLAVDILVEPYEDGYRIQIPSITFPGNSADLILDQNDPRGVQNVMVLDRLVDILGRFPEYSIVVEGHAVNLSGTEREEREELVPLSRQRAESVVQALIDRGVSPRLLTARGRGGSAPVVPHSDEQNRWKNRRVVFILQR